MIFDTDKNLRFYAEFNPAFEAIAKFIEEKKVSGLSVISFIIGGSNGLSKAVLDKADLILSFGKITFPHQLFRVVLAEQIYRAFTIIDGLPYHK